MSLTVAVFVVCQICFWSGYATRWFFSDLVRKPSPEDHEHVSGDVK